VRARITAAGWRLQAPRRNEGDTSAAKNPSSDWRGGQPGVPLRERGGYLTPWSVELMMVELLAATCEDITESGVRNCGTLGIMEESPIRQG
jgi:hypothetical protein